MIHRGTRTRNTAIWLMVALAHVLVLWWLTIGRSTLPPESFPPPIELWLVPPVGGGGSSAAGDGSKASASAPSSLHRPEELFKVFPDAPVAPPAPAVEPPPIPGGGAAPTALPVPSGGVALSAAPAADGQDLGSGEPGRGDGQGGGAGPGTGAGPGRGNGPGAGIALIRGPQGAVITANPSLEMLGSLGRPYATLNCWLETGSPRLRDCRIAYESRPGVGEAALRASPEWVFRPPARIGRATRRVRVTVAHAPPVDSSSPDAARH